MKAALRKVWRELYWGPSDLRRLIRARFPQWVIYFGGTGFGDDLLLTAVLEELRQRGWKRLAVVSKHEQIFRHGPREIVYCNEDWRLLDAARRIGSRVVHPLYLLDAQPEYDVPSRSHLIAEMCRSAGMRGPVSLRPYFYLTDEEKKRGWLSERQAVIQCPNPATMPHAPLKAWSIDGMREVVAALQGTLDFVQLGGKDDPVLPGAKDLRGQTSLRESAALLANSRVNIGYVGFLMHLARAVECRSVVIFGGRERPDQSGYAANENLFTAMVCSPCWRRYQCLYDHDCMRSISAADVVAAVHRVLQKADTPLLVEKVEIPSEAAKFPLPWLTSLSA